jgi:hypothetical protein
MGCGSRGRGERGALVSGGDPPVGSRNSRGATPVYAKAPVTWSDAPAAGRSGGRRLPAFAKHPYRGKYAGFRPERRETRSHNFGHELRQRYAGPRGQATVVLSLTVRRVYSLCLNSRRPPGARIIVHPAAGAREPGRRTRGNGSSASAESSRMSSSRPAQGGTSDCAASFVSK